MALRKLITLANVALAAAAWTGFSFANPVYSLPSTLGSGDVSFINKVASASDFGSSTLPLSLQNGNSTYGLLNSPALPKFLGSSGKKRQTTTPPWGNKNAFNTNEDTDIPSTGVTRSYSLHIARDRISPDGYQKNVILINGQFPGPLLEANWGDWVEITVYNDIFNPEEGTSLHWHGLSQANTPFMDGVPSVSQCPIPPGSSLIYRFRATQFGTTWYHSHFTAQYTDGLYGPMVIYGPSSADYDIDLGPVIVADYYHKPYAEVMKQAMGSLPASETTYADNVLIQGKMRYDCSKGNTSAVCVNNASLAKFAFAPGKVHRLRFINPSTFAVMKVAIDAHSMVVIAQDFVPIKPYTTQAFTLAAGQRVDVLVTAKPSPSSFNGVYGLRFKQPSDCSPSGQAFGMGAIYYPGADPNNAPGSAAQAAFAFPTTDDCNNEALANTAPAYAVQPPVADATLTITIAKSQNATGSFLYYQNGQTFHGNFNKPILSALQQGDLSFFTQPDQAVFNLGTNQSVRIVFINQTPFTHPMHIHGQNMYVLNEGLGTWDGSVVRSTNPVRRDTQILRARGYMVAQLVATNPGVWPFHCHFAWHVSQGLYMNIVQKPAQVKGIPVPQSFVDNCKAWNTWTTNHRVDVIDSGVRLLREA